MVWTFQFLKYSHMMPLVCGKHEATSEMAVQTEGKLVLTLLELVPSDHFLYVVPQICVWEPTLVFALMFTSPSAILITSPLYCTR